MLIGYFNKYKNMIGTIEYDVGTKTYYGEIVNVNTEFVAYVSYDAGNIIDLEKAFHDKTSSYIEECVRRGVKVHPYEYKNEYESHVSFMERKIQI